MRLGQRRGAQWMLPIKSLHRRRIRAGVLCFSLFVELSYGLPGFLLSLKSELALELLIAFTMRVGQVQGLQHIVVHLHRAAQVSWRRYFWRMAEGGSLVSFTSWTCSRVLVVCFLGIGGVLLCSRRLGLGSCKLLLILF